MGSNFSAAPLLWISEIELAVFDLVGGNDIYIEDYLALYLELFPQYSRYVPVMRSRAGKPENALVVERWHQWLLVVNGKPAGLAGFVYNRARNLGILLDFAIRADARNIYHLNKRFARFVLDLMLGQLKADARANGSDSPLCLAAEVEHAALLKRYCEYGFVVFPVEYYEPPFTPELAALPDLKENLDKMGYERMFLGAFPMPETPLDPTDPDLVKTVVLALLKDHYRLPDGHWLVGSLLHRMPG